MPYGSSRGGGYPGYTPGGDEYDLAFKRGNIGPFSYAPDPNDPELQLARSRALRFGESTQSNTLNELARAGLIGSSAAFGVMGQDQQNLGRQLEDIDSGVFAKRRGEAYDLYRGEQDFRRELEMMRLRQLLQEQMQDDSGFWGGLGDFVGSAAGSFLPIPGGGGKSKYGNAGGSGGGADRWL